MNNSNNYKHFDSLIAIEEMTLQEYNNGGVNLEIHYSFASCPFGKILIASTPKGICNLSYVSDDESKAKEVLQKKFHRLTLIQKTEPMHIKALSFFEKEKMNKQEKIILHLKGTVFQLKVWKALLEIPMGELVSYRDIAIKIDYPKAYRAVGNAIRDNPVFFIIPCHRVIQASGAIGNYYWGTLLKTEIIRWESNKNSQLQVS
jgi:AraC family transcriptional regulator, regulatory protein of adaptative response / methylated-DNA-[protein]-cysteine methyltransferase